MLAAMTAVAEEAATELPFPPVVFGIGAFVGFVALLLATYAFRHAGTKH